MNPVELLMIEHSSLRLRFQMIETQAANSIFEVDEFVRNCHAKVEDEIVFPILKSRLNFMDKEQVVLNVLSRLEADHKLIDRIGGEIKLRTVEGNSQLLSKRISLYCSTVKTHNFAEETQIFPYWQNDFETPDTRERVMKIIRQFGMSRYYEITGSSQELIKMFEEKK